MAFLLNYNFQIQSKNSNPNTHGVYNPNNSGGNNNNNNNQMNHYQNNNNNNQRSPPRKLSHFDDSFPLETHTITRTSTLRDEDDYRYSINRSNFEDDQLIFVIDDL